MQFDLVTVLGIGVLAGMAIFLNRHRRRGAAGGEDHRTVNQRRDVARALKSMRKD